MICNFNLYDKINAIIENEYKDAINIVNFGSIYNKKIKKFFDNNFNDFFLVDYIKSGDDYIFNLKDAKNKKDYVMKYFISENKIYIFPKKYDNNDYDFTLDNYEQILFDNDKFVYFGNNRLIFLQFDNNGANYRLFDFSNKKENSSTYEVEMKKCNAMRLLGIYTRIINKKLDSFNNEFSLYYFISTFVNEIKKWDTSNFRNNYKEISNYLKCDFNLYLDKILDGYDFLEVDNNERVMIDTNYLNLYKVENGGNFKILPCLENKNINNLIALENKDKCLFYFEFKDNYLLVDSVSYDNKFNINSINSKYYDISIIYYLMEKENLDLCSLVSYFVNNYKDLVQKYKLIPNEEFDIAKLETKIFPDNNKINKECFFDYSYFNNGVREIVPSYAIDDGNILTAYNSLLKSKYKKRNNF